MAKYGEIVSFGLFLLLAAMVAAKMRVVRRARRELLLEGLRMREWERAKRAKPKAEQRSEEPS